MNKLFEQAGWILDILEKNNYEGYFVGGAVRDYLLNRPINDVDITTNALPDEIEQLFERTIDVGKEHGTIVVLIEDTPFEVTTYRTEGTYSNYRRPDQVFFTENLQDDLSRRDFTINAMAMMKNMTLFDPYHGQNDLEEKVINTVGAADERFGEDALRMLRAVRFMSQLDFKLTENVKAAIHKNKALLDHIASERSFTELKKMYAGLNPSAAQNIIAETGLLEYIPFFKHVHKDTYLRACVSNIEEALVMHIYHDQSLLGFLNELKPSNHLKNQIRDSLSLIDDLSKKENSKLIAYYYNSDVMDLVLHLNQNNGILSTGSVDILISAISERDKLVINSRSELSVDGRVLMQALERQGGPWLKTLLSEIEKQVVLGQLENDQDEIINWVKNHAKYEE